MNDPVQSNPTPPPAAPSSFEMNHPTIIALLHLGGFLTGGLGNLVAVILAFVWKGEPHEAWEDSHYQYLINTFWIGLVGSCVSFILLFVLIGVLTWLAVAALVIVRAVLSLIKAQKREPMPNPGTLLA